jgi:hypothetical protein
VNVATRDPCRTALPRVRGAPIARRCDCRPWRA